MDGHIYQLNEYSDSFKECVRKNLTFARYMEFDCSGTRWEQIVSEGMKAKWRKSNDGLSDIYNPYTAWSAKTIQKPYPEHVKYADIISGRIQVQDYRELMDSPNEIGRRIIDTWNKRVFDAIEEYNDIRTIVLIRSPKMDRVVVFEELTEPYNSSEYTWKFNSKNVLEGYDSNDMRKFSWQPSGTQFRIVSKVPFDKRIILDIPYLGKRDERKIDMFLNNLGYVPYSTARDEAIRLDTIIDEL